MKCKVTQKAVFEATIQDKLAQNPLVCIIGAVIGRVGGVKGGHPACSRSVPVAFPALAIANIIAEKSNSKSFLPLLDISKHLCYLQKVKILQMIYSEVC